MLFKWMVFLAYTISLLSITTCTGTQKGRPRDLRQFEIKEVTHQDDSLGETLLARPGRVVFDDEHLLGS